MMTWRDHTWEFTVIAMSWLVVLGALVVIATYVAYDAHKTRQAGRPKARR